nr:MAG TPA: Neck appendage protein [Caudoviricetes sp.]
MDALTRRQFDRAMFAKERTLAIRVGDYASRDIKEASFEYGYVKGDTYKPGGTCAGSGKITFTSIITTFNKLDILHPEIGLLVGNTYQWVKMGEYFINDIEIDRNRNTTTLELMDGMFKLNREYVTDLHFPAEVREVIQEICLKTGIELANDYFGISAMRYHVEQVPEGKKLSFRDMLSAMTQMIGMSCFFNREGKMEIRDLTESNITINADSYFLHGLTKSEIEYQIAGITCKTDKKSLTVGMKTGRSLELDNVFMTQSALNDLYYKLKNLTYYPYNLNYQGHLLLEVGQWVTIQTNKKETFKVPVLSQSFTFKGGLRGRISADSKAGNDTQYSYEGTITKQIKQQDGIEAKIQAQIEAADAAFDAEFKKRKKEIDDGIELAKAKAEEVKQELSDTIDQRFNSFNNGPLKEAKRKAEEALRNAGASSLLAQESKQIGLDSVARLEAFKSQTTNAQTAFSGDLDALKQTIANDIRPKQAQAESEIAKQVEALIQTKKELAGVKSAQATYEETTTRRLAELTNLANGKASKSELTQTAEELASKIASVQVGGRNYIRGTRRMALASGLWTSGTFRPSGAGTAKTIDVPNSPATGFDKAIRLTSSNARDQIGIAQDRFEIMPGTYTISVWVKGSVGQRVKLQTYWEPDDATGISSYFILKDDKWTYLTFSSERKKAGTVSIGYVYLVNADAGEYLDVLAPQLENGSLATSPKEAPEDTDGQISAVESNFRQRADSLDASVRSLTEGLRTKADISELNVTAENIRQSVKKLETDTQNKLNQKLSQAEFEVQAGSIRQEILNATKDKADKTLVVAEAGKLREEFSKMKVGSRNYAEDYDFSRGLWYYSQGDNSPQDWIISNGEYNVKGTTNTWKQMQIQSKEGSRSSWKGSTSLLDLEVGETYTLSFQGICYSGSSSVWLSLRANRTVSGYAEIMYGNFTLTSSWQTYQITIPALTKPDNFDFWRIILGYSEIGHVAFRKVELTRSSTRIDAGPAPEDGKTDLVVAKSEFQKTAEGLSAKMSAVESYVGQDSQRQEALRIYTREESARQATAVRELVAKDYVGKATYQETVRAIENKFEAITNPQNGSIATQIANYKKSVDGRFADITSLIAGKANQTDFQRVKETSQLYERILGNTENGIADKVARMAMTNQLFQVEVAKAAKGGRNYIRNGQFKNGSKNWFEFQSVNFGLNFNYQHSLANRNRPGLHFYHESQDVAYFFGIQQSFAFDGVRGEKVSVSLLVSKDGGANSNLKIGLHYIKNKNIIGQEWQIIPSTQITSKYKRFTFTFTLSDDVENLNLMFYGEKGKTIDLYVTDVQLERGSVATDYKEAIEDTDEAIRTVQSQLAGSWAVQNINSAGDIISGINLGANGHNRITGKLTHITGDTLIDNAVIKSAMVDKLKTSNFEAGSVTTTILDAEAVTADKVRFDNAFIRKMITNEAFIEQLTSKRIFATKVESVVSSSTFLEAYQGRIGGFTLGQFDQGGGRWISGVNQFSVGMGNGAGYGVRTAFWANWGNNWNYAGPKAWNVNTDGKMYCRNEVGFYDQVDFSNASRANFYGTTTFSRSPVFSNGIELGSKDVFGDGSNPKGGRNAVVWWNQVGSGSVKYWMEQKSDRRLKENITDTAVKALDKINRLRMVAFDFIESKKHEEIGLIAQEVETIVPRIVSRDPENPDGYLHIDYTALVPYLIKAIQELNQKIEKMEKTIA